MTVVIQYSSWNYLVAVNWGQVGEKKRIRMFHYYWMTAAGMLAVTFSFPVDQGASQDGRIRPCYDDILPSEDLSVESNEDTGGSLRYQLVENVFDSNLAAGSCDVLGITVLNREIFTTASQHCVEFECNDGVVSTIKEGCESNGTCYNLDTTFVEDCTTYRCSKSVQDGVTSYSTSAVETMCRDAGGNCHRSGETVYYNNIKCTCMVKEEDAKYTCTT
ncbi:hypothetical protein Btru_023246 [Bulinus truncatus]|nr:hypothetical protein Btru_023246 [Bulinus truncatus]